MKFHGDNLDEYCIWYWLFPNNNQYLCVIHNEHFSRFLNDVLEERDFIDQVTFDKQTNEWTILVTETAKVAEKS